MTDEADDSAALRRWLILGSRRHKPVVLFLYVLTEAEVEEFSSHRVHSDERRQAYAAARYGVNLVTYGEWYHDAKYDPRWVGKLSAAEDVVTTPEKPLILQVIEHNTTQPYPWLEEFAESYLTVVEHTENALRTSISLVTGAMRAYVSVK